MKTTLLNILGTLLLVCSFMNSQAQRILLDEAEVINLGDKYSYYIDEASELTIGEVSQADFQHQFQISEQTSPNFGNTAATVWGKFTIVNHGTDKWILEVGSWVLDTFNLYVPEGDGHFQLRHASLHDEFTTREIANNNYNFHLPLRMGEEITFFFKVNSLRMQFPLTLATGDKLLELKHKDDTISGIFYGFALLIVLYNLFLFVSTKQRSYGFYILYVLCSYAYISWVQGFLFEWLGDWSLWMNDYGVLFTVAGGASSVIFTMSFLNTKRNMPRMHKALKVSLAIFIIPTIMNISGFVIPSNIFQQVYMLCVMLFLYACGVRAWQHGYSHAIFYVISRSVLVVGVVVYILKTLMILPTNMFTNYGVHWGTAGEMILLSIALANKINAYKKQKEIAQAEALGATQKANEQLEYQVLTRTAQIREQKEMIEERNKDITDSIGYAKRIQSAILPPDTQVSTLLEDAYILYKPKDIVAGDFYWMEETKDHLIFATADCTGHGVPGAMVSVVCNGALNRSVREFGLTSPAEILDKTRDLVIKTFEKSVEDIHDGMDIAICSLNRRTGELQFAGANNPLYVVKKRTPGLVLDEKTIMDDHHYIEEVPADRQPISNFRNASPFTCRTVDTENAEMIILFTDGYADQFGGTKGKKLKYKPFKQLMLKNFYLPIKEQEAKLDKEFTDWQGDQEQVDDVCVMAIRLDTLLKTQLGNKIPAEMEAGK